MSKKYLDELKKMQAQGNSPATFSYRDKLKKKKYQSKATNFYPDLMNTLSYENIAPVRTTTKAADDERTWFQAGAFDDGFDIMDVPKTILGTVGDTEENFTAGILGMGETTVDAMASLVPWGMKAMEAPLSKTRAALLPDGGEKVVSELYDKALKTTDDFIAKDLYDEEEVAKKLLSYTPSGLVRRGIGVDSETDSLLGEKSDALIQSGGQLAATAGLTAVGLPWWATTAVTSFGSEMEAGLNEGATHEEATLSAAISAGAEVLTEKISGGIKFGGKTLDDALTKRLARGVSNKAVRTLTKLGMDMGGEGAEEVLSGVMSAVGQKLTYADDKELNELFSKEDAWEALIGGAVLGGVSSAGGAVKSKINGVDAVTGLTKNEQAVVDKEYENRLAEEEKDGKKLTQREKNELHDKVLHDMERGYISTDTIEEVLGGETYKSYRDTVKNAEALQQEYDTLYKMKNGEKSDEQIDRQAELKKQLEELKATDKSNALKSQLGEEVLGLVKGDRLIESYNERSRKGQAFEADLSKYDKAQQAVIQKAIDSKILNNSNRTHEFVDLVAKISADKGVPFDFTNNAKLKESGFAIDGKQVNGFVTKDGITLNIDSSKMAEKVVGHEITHVLEGTELYTEFRNVLFEYAKAKGEFDSRRSSLAELYKDVEGADVYGELAADLVGDYLFNDTDFINKLSTENRNVFQKLYDEIKYLCKVATAGSKEARELERVKRAFEEAYRASGSAENSDSARYSISGKNAKTANYLRLDEAIKMEDIGKATSEEIRQQTGWFRGYDGKWRFEISDSDMNFNIAGHFANPDVLRYRELEYKFITDTDNMTEAEISEMRSLSKALEGVKKTPKTLGDYLKHDKLYEAYPQLRDIPIRYDYLSGGALGGYNPGRNEITLDYRLRDDIPKLESTLIHEIQHAIQEIEGFAFGSSVEYWERQRKDVVDSIKGARKNLDLWLKDIGYPEYVKTSMQKIANGEKTIDEHWSDIEAFKANSKYAEQIANCEAEIAEYQRRYDETTNGMTASEQYLNTAGEIEARDVEARRWRSEDALLETRPDIDRTDVVFAEGNARNNTKPTAEPDIRYSLSEADNAYMDAANRGDTETAQRMVDKAASGAGYNYRGVHRATVFDKSKIGSGAGLQFGDGFYVSLEIKDKATADYADSAYGKVKMDLYVKMQSPLELGKPISEETVARLSEDLMWFGDDDSVKYGVAPEVVQRQLTSGDSYEQMEAIRWLSKENGMKISELLKKYGFDGIISANEYVTQAVVWDENQLKSADPITYDDAGNVIPLSERFNPENNDIRYSLSNTGEAPAFGSLRDMALETAPVQEATVAENTTVAEAGRFAPIAETETEAPKATVQATQKEVSEKIKNFQTELESNLRMREQSKADFDKEIARLQAKYNSLGNKNTIKANDLLRRIERTRRMQGNVDADYAKRIENLEGRIEKMNTPTYQTAMQRRAKQQEYSTLMENLVGDTSTWRDKKLGISYKTNTLKRNLRDVIRDANGNRDIAKADAIYNELQGKYNHNEALLNREATQIKKPYADMKITKAEDAYIQMLGELRHNPDTTLTEDVVNKFYEAHKGSIDTDKVDKAIAEARKTYDELLIRVNKVLKEQGMKEIPYRKGYFPHFTEDKQGFLAKLFNWKTRNNEIPTDIAGLTEAFNPNRSWQSFNKQRKGDTTDYSFQKGLDTYVQGALDWVHHIEDIQKRRAFENYIRYVHSEQGVKERIDAIRKNEEYDADEAQDQIDLVLAEARNPLNNFVTDLRAGTNTLANKKSSMDRGMEEALNRKFYSTMTNINSRVSANMVGGSVSSALTNFIPITQSWGEVSPVSSLRAMGDTIRSTFRDDGMVDKSDFLTNRLRKADNLYKTGWDKVSDAIGLMMEGIDSFTSQTVWRSKYLENISNGMSEAQAIKNADEFAESVIAGRSRGNQPTIFDSKNPLIRTLTAFQLEVNNQYGYMFKDMPQDMQADSKAKLVKGYVTMFLGAYAYNALYSKLTGRDAAFDPIGIIEELLRDLGWIGDDEEEEPKDAALHLVNNVLEEAPFLGGLLGGGRVPISSAMPYSGEYEGIEAMATDIAEGNWDKLAKEMLNPVYYLALPMGGGQIRKTVQGLSMFSDDHPVAGSYTDSGNLRFPVEDTLLNRIQAGIFGQYSSDVARDYFDNGRSALREKQIQEYIDVEMPIRDYWDYREGLNEQETLEDKFEYIAGLDLSTEQKNILINNVVDRKDKVDMENYDDFSGYEEFDFYSKNTEKYNFLKDNGISYREYTSSEDAKEEYDATWSWYKNNPEKVTVSKAVTDNVIEYRKYTSDLYDIKADKDENGDSISGSAKEKKIEYINSLDLDYGERIILFRTLYDGKADKDKYNPDIIEYLNGRADISYEEMVTILEELDMTVAADGVTVTW